MASAGEVTITWLGHASTLIETPNRRRILIDPWLQHNPATPERFKQLDRLDLMLITHGHADHMGDAVEIAQATHPDVIAIVEIAGWLQSKGVEKTTGVNKGGTFHWDGVDITMVDAVHSSGITDGDSVVYGGTAGGFVLRFADGFTVYHAGDSDVFEGFGTIGRMYHPDVALLPIGDHFTMGPSQAAEAIRLLGVARVIPIHFGTFPILTGTPEQLVAATRDIKGVRIVTLQPGESVSQSALG